MLILIKVSVAAAVVAVALAFALIYLYGTTEGNDAVVLLRWGVASLMVAGIFTLIAWGGHCTLVDRRRMAKRITDLEAFREEAACRMWARSAVDRDDAWFERVLGDEWADPA